MCKRFFLAAVLLFQIPLYADHLEEEGELPDESQTYHAYGFNEGCGCRYNRGSGCWPNCNGTEGSGKYCTHYHSQGGEHFTDCQYACICGMPGVWLPEDPPLFKPFMADPRALNFSAGWRFCDDAMAPNIIDVSYDSYIALYRWCCVGPWKGQLQFAVQGALWAIFDPCCYTTPLVNADYYGGLQFSYAFPCWAFRVRLYHISSHLGDEFLLLHPDFDRRNPSAEYLDFFVSHELTDDIRMYGGLGYILHEDESFPCSRFYTEGGVSLHFHELGFTDYCNRTYGTPIFGMHFRWKEDFKHHVDATYVLGYEFGKLCGLERVLRFFVEYHDGYSLEGQFCQEPTSYVALRMSYGY